MTLDEWKQVQLRLQRLFPRSDRLPIPPDAAVEWFEGLEEFDLADVVAGVRNWAKASPWPPALNQLRDAAYNAVLERRAQANREAAERERAEKERQWGELTEEQSKRSAVIIAVATDHVHECSERKLGRKVANPIGLDAKSPDFFARFWDEVERRIGDAERSTASEEPCGPA